MSKTHHLALLAPLFLGACAPRPAVVPDSFTGINLSPMTLAEADPEVRDSCAESIQLALLRRGITVNLGGPRVDVEVSFWEDAGLGPPTGAYEGDLTANWGGTAMSPTARRSGYTADLTATIHEGRTTRKVMSSGTADFTEPMEKLRPVGGPSRITACSMAAERLASALVEVFNDASR